MSSIDFIFVFQWWITFFFIGISCVPLMLLLFPGFFDRGYIFAKVIGIILLSYLALILGEIHLIPFSSINILFLLIILAIVNLVILLRHTYLLRLLKSAWKFFILEEIIFFIGMLFWSFVRGTAPDIHGLEKYMDYGFVNSIIRAQYFPPKDMWYPPFSINYYYFGHFATAVLTKLSHIPSQVSFNLMLATLFAFTLTCSFSLGANFLCLFFKKILEEKYSTQQTGQKATKHDRRNKSADLASLTVPTETQNNSFWSLKATILTSIGALLTAYIATFSGNLHTIYTFFKPYDNENPVPFWQKAFSPNTFPNNYWYPNATRFIYHTIHEFPIYSFVVSDLHGHVTDIPFVLLAIAILFSFLVQYKTTTAAYKLFITISLGFLIAVMYMTNAWDGIIYFLLTILVFLYVTKQDFPSVSNKEYATSLLLPRYSIKDYILQNGYYLSIAFISFIVFSLPFSLFFKPFASQIGILCAPKFLTNIGHLGPFLFEVDHCQHSPIYQLLILHGFFLFWVAGLIAFLFFQRKKGKIYQSDVFVILLSIISILLIIIPEFVYLKDIYPAHYRANTMFKLVYQSFIMLSLCSGYIIMRLLISVHSYTTSKAVTIVFTILYLPIGAIFLALVSIYPYFAISSYYNNLQTYYGLDGTKYLQRTYPTDYEGITWLNENVPDQPVILEAQGDSYTDYARVSTNTGLPTPLGWTVHEWLWRGSYDLLPMRFNDIQKMYETTSVAEGQMLAKKYNVQYVFVGDLERKKYTNLNENKFLSFGKLIFKKGNTTIYQIYP